MSSTISQLTHLPPGRRSTITILSPNVGQFPDATEYRYYSPGILFLEATLQPTSAPSGR